MGINVVNYAGNTLVDMTDATVTDEDLMEGVTAYGANGEKVTGTMIHVKIKKLWSNASPGSSFGEQAISINCTENSLYLVELRQGTGTTTRMFAWCNGTNGTYADMMINVATDGSNNTMLRRTVKAADSKLNISNCTVKVGTTVSTNNIYLIPVALYEISGITSDIPVVIG